MIAPFINQNFSSALKRCLVPSQDAAPCRVLPGGGGSQHAVEGTWRLRWQLRRIGGHGPVAQLGLDQPCVASGARLLVEEEAPGASLLVEEEAPASQVLGTLQGDPRELHSGDHHMKQGLHGELQCAPTG